MVRVAEGIRARLTGRLTGNTLILLANNIGSAGLAFIISVLIGRGLGVVGFGQYSFIMAWLAPLITLADFGMGSLITRDVAQNREAALSLLHTATRGLLLIAGLLLIVAWIAIPTLNLPPAEAIALALTALLIILDPWYGLYTALFRAFGQMWPILVINVGGFAVQLILTAIALHSGTGLIGVAAVLIGINMFQLAITWQWWRMFRIKASLTRPLTPSPSPRKDGEAEKPGQGNLWIVLRRAWPFALAAVLSTLQLRLSVLLLEHIAGDAAVGLYAAGNRFVEAARLLPGAFFGALFPALASLAAQPQAMRRTFLRASRLILVFGVSFGLAMTLFGGWIIQRTYNATFADAAPILTVLAWALVPSLLRSVLTLYLYSQHREQLVNVVTLIALVCQVVIGWLLITRWGAIGAAFSVGIVEGGTVVCLWYVSRGQPAIYRDTVGH